MEFELSNTEKQKRKTIVQQTRQMVLSNLPIEDADETSLMTNYRDCYLQISFSQMHPLMVFGIAKPLQYPCTKEQRKHINELNLKSILGCYAINDDAGCYSYRATHWLDKTMEAPRFFEILDRCIDEAERGYQKVVE